MARSIELFVILSLTVVALSHILRPTAWGEYFALLRRQGGAGAMINGMMSLWFGAAIVAFHNIWTGPAMLITLLGWAQVLKGTLHLCLPGLGERSMRLVERNGKLKFQAAGATMLVLAAAMSRALFA